MNLNELRNAQAYFIELIPIIRAERQKLYNLRDEFRRYYTIEQIRTMPIEHYSLGMEYPDKGYLFCHTMEYALTGLGETKGAQSSKFGVYFGRTKSDQVDKWRVTKRYGTAADINGAYANVRQAVYDLVIAGRSKDLEAIISNTLPPIFKGKILSTFFPEDYLNVFSDVHLNFFLTQLGLDTESLRNASEVMKREELVRFKNSDPVMKNWSMDDYMVFLYRCYPGRPPKHREDEENDTLSDYRDPEFPQFPNPEWINLDILPPSVATDDDSNGQGVKDPTSNPDYEKEARFLKKLGNRGEEIVLNMERERLRNAGFAELANKVVQAEYDYLGYDIKSFEFNGEARHIEVKATRAKVGQANFFLSANEFKKSATLENYHLYMVYDIMSPTPKIWVVPNPFHPKNNKVFMTEMSYRVTINTQK